MGNNVGNVTGSGATQNYYNKVYHKKQKDTENTPVDTYTAGDKTKDSTKGIYSKDSATIQKFWDQANAANTQLRNLVEQMLGTGKTGGQGFWAMASDPAQYGINIDEQARADAAAMIADDGYYGVEQTTARIVDFAKALAGGKADEKTIENLRNGAQKGFDAVAKMFGGFENLPDVTKKTYEAVMKAFDDWKAEVTANTETESVVE